MIDSTVKNFIYNERLFSELADFVEYLEDEVELLEANNFIEVDLTVEEPLVTLELDWLVEIITECNEERFSEDDADKEILKIKQALMKSVDFDKFNAAMPNLHYTNYKKYRFKTSDLLKLQANR